MDQRDQLVRLLRQLPPRQRTAVVLRYWEELTEAGAAEVMDCSAGTVRSATSRGLQRLREFSGIEDGAGGSAGHRPAAGRIGSEDTLSTELERQLRAGMERVEARVPRDLARQAYRRYRKRATTRIVAAAGTAAVVAGAATGSPRARLDAHVAGRVSTAMTRVSGDMVRIRTTYTGLPIASSWAYSVGWAYGHTIRSTNYTEAGQVYWDREMTSYGHSRLAAVNVDYPAGNYVRVTPGMRRWSFGGPIGGPAVAPPATCVMHGPPSAFMGPFLASGQAPSWAAYFRAVLNCGQFRLAGHQRLGGTNTIELVQVPTRQPWYRDEKIWVDSSTYRPVVMEYDNDGPAQVVHATFTWLPPTRANLAHLTAPVPAGFRRVTSNNNG